MSPTTIARTGRLLMPLLRSLSILFPAGFFDNAVNGLHSRTCFRIQFQHIEALLLKIFRIQRSRLLLLSARSLLLRRISLDLFFARIINIRIPAAGRYSGIHQLDHRDRMSLMSSCIIRLAFGHMTWVPLIIHVISLLRFRSYLTKPYVIRGGNNKHIPFPRYFYC